MGMRINKMIGYGLTDVATEGYKIADPRINADSFLLTGIEEPDAGHPSYDQWLKQQTTGDEMADLDILMELASLESVGAEDAYSTVVHKSEYGMPNVLLVRPVGFPDWHRHADPIDWEERVIQGATLKNSVDRTLGGIHPWAGLHMDIRSGEKITGTLVNSWRRVANNPSEADESRKPLLDRLAMGLGYQDHAEAERFIAPWVPDEIRRVCAWGELFTSPEVYLQLRPLLYTYWA